MPHDKNGKELQVGDEVNVKAKITHIYQTSDYCNLSLETIEVMHPGTITSTLNLNSRQVEKCHSGAVEPLGDINNPPAPEPPPGDINNPPGP